MHSGFEITGIHHPPQQQPENPLLLSMNPTHILDQIHTSQQPLPLHHLLPPHYPPSPFFPLNFKLGLNDIHSTSSAAANSGGGDALLRGSQQYHLPEARQSSLGMLHSQFWEPLPAEVSNENSEIVRRREALATCLDAKSRAHFSELEAVYKRHGNAEATQTAPNLTTTPPPLPEEEPSRTEPKKAKRKKKKKATDSDPQQITPMEEFFENLVKQVLEHQENLQRKFTEVIDRLSEERRAREEAWRSQELAHLEREAAARAHEKAMAKSREATIVSYLEKITGQRINMPTPESAAANTSDDSNCGGGEDRDRD
ncbi:hypothetical protein SASPL_153259 [Salvia splendens]|uniref:Uncharacterized protein n=1 Tax=Salvia splendens TaxID=180675 RepID=A0A8X8Z0U4_SALSN|nr:uncharacterized protein LOC121783249 [Salvia splendens]KAG6388062.1 hypothetical protein SASPL_153259 [Salvia splendens]